MKSIITHFNFIIVVLLMVSSSVFSQESKVTGTVTDESGFPILGASIVIIGTSTGTQTDFDGKYSINLQTVQKLQCSYIGMKTITKTLKGQLVIG